MLNRVEHEKSFITLGPGYSTFDAIHMLMNSSAASTPAVKT